MITQLAQADLPFVDCIWSKMMNTFYSANEISIISFHFCLPIELTSRLPSGSSSQIDYFALLSVEIAMHTNRRAAGRKLASRAGAGLDAWQLLFACF
jgi:hypothetical protein